MHGEHALDALAVGDAAYSKCFIEPAAFASNHDSSKYLDPFLVSFHNSRMDSDVVAHLECVGVGFLLLFLDGIDGLIHKYPAARAGEDIFIWSEQDRKSTRLNSSHVSISY